MKRSQHVKAESSLGKGSTSFEHVVAQPSKRMLCAQCSSVSPVAKREPTTPRHLQPPFPCFLCWCPHSWQGSVLITAGTELTCRGNSPCCLCFSWFYSFICLSSLASPQVLSCQTHTAFYKRSKKSTSSSLYFGWWGDARFASHVTASGREGFSIKL